jgi:NAD(P)-dependent dehydrogenase (short-subunit alcohol dehydrogenase family)
LDIDLSGKTGLITGATCDWSRVIARTLGSCGTNVAALFASDTP